MTTSLHLAIEFGDVEIAETLVKMNVDVNTKEPRLGRTPLHLAVKNNDQQMVQMLLNNQADVNQVSHDNLTALHIAVANRCASMVDTLILYGANVNPGNKFCGKTPLYMAVEYNCPDIVKALLKAGASIKDAATPNTTIFDVLDNIGDRNLTQTLFSFMRQNHMKLPPLRYILDSNSLPSDQKAKIKRLHAKYYKYDSLFTKLFKKNTAIRITKIQR